MTGRATSFGADASAYERFRPGYPDALVEQVIAYAGRPVRSALEIGAGTGKATRLFADRGIAVTATDPDPRMLAELARHGPASVRVVRAAFEELTLQDRFDLVFVAASLHWTRREGRWERVAALLVGGGTFAGFGGQVRLADPDAEAALRGARSAFLPDDDPPLPDGAAADDRATWPADELERSALFTDVRSSVLGRRWTTTATGYVGHLSTVSAYLALPPAVRGRALEAIRRALPEQVEVTADVSLVLARTR